MQSLSLLMYSDMRSHFSLVLNLFLVFNFSASKASTSSFVNSKTGLLSEPAVLGGPLAGARSGAAFTTANACLVGLPPVAAVGILGFAIFLFLSTVTSSVPYLLLEGLEGIGALFWFLGGAISEKDS